MRQIISRCYAGCPGAVLVVVLLAAGCASNRGQVARCQEDKEQLLATIRQQRDTSRALREQVASLETRLDQAEKELARGPSGTRVSTRPPDPAPPVKTESLPWRPPPDKSGPGAATGENRRTSTRPVAPGLSLMALADRDRRLQYDAGLRSARLDTTIDFDDGTATLTAEGKRQLDELARLLKSDAARDLRVMTAGYAVGRPPTTARVADGESRFASARQLAAARAQAVADYLDRHGIAQERLGVTGTGSRSPVTGAQSDKLAASGGVEIYLLEPNAPVVGWGPTGTTLRR